MSGGGFALNGKGMPVPLTSESTRRPPGPGSPARSEYGGAPEPTPAWLGRPNLVERREEAWQPPAFTRSRLAAVRRFLDLQAGSIWNDLATLLPPQRGVVLDVGCGAQPYRSLL